MFSIDKIKELSSARTLEELLPDAKKTGDMNTVFAAVYIATRDALGITPFDTQLRAAKALDDGKIVEMYTGEGKTLSAVFTAVYNVFNGHSVHILTFNDYLASRDCRWMEPLYKKMGVEVGVITEKTPLSERRSIYEKDVVYLTAKESGFDFLRDFTVYNTKEKLHSGLDFAIVDEADSILIDEARIPLVIAGSVRVQQDEKLVPVLEMVRKFTSREYEVSEKDKSAYLTEAGARAVEKAFSIRNIYDSENNELLTLVNDCLRACYVLRIDKDYIKKDNDILLIDEFTGRVARHRHYPGSLQTAVELLNGVKATTRGKVLGQIPLQFFLKQYKKLSGMTGTATAARSEFFELYGLSLEVIPPHVPSNRTDHRMQIYCTSAIKWERIADCIKKAHDKRQPVLIGTGSVEESELLESKLRDRGIERLQILNAKNDEMEAEIIRDAGALGNVTVSTNMAGRGIDIKLGGADEKTRDEVIAAGGLLVIGTSMAESPRINAQLSGRAGRQGDVGESRLFTALDDPLMKVYGLVTLVPRTHWCVIDDNEVTDYVVRREVERIGRIAEGETLERRKRMLRFTMISEKHRASTFAARERFLNGAMPHIWQDNAPEEYETAAERFGEDAVNTLQRELIIIAINDFWSEYLDFADTLKYSIHFVRVAGKVPSEEFNIACENYYDGMEQALTEHLLVQLSRLLKKDRLEEYPVERINETWTYLLEDGSVELDKKTFLEAALGSEEKPKENAPLLPRGTKKSFFKALLGK